jgi:hypothetical protein
MVEFTPLPHTRAHSGAYVTTRAADAEQVVFLLGWADAPLKYVQKYASIYPDNTRVVVLLSEFKHFVYTKHALVQQMSPAIEWLQEQQDNAGHPLPLVMHLFSNGGALLLSSLELAAQRAGVQLDIQGIVCDSAPSEGRLVEGVKVGTMWVRNPVLRHLLSLLVAAVLVAFRLGAMVRGELSTFEWIWSTLSNPKRKCTRLMLYSEADAMVGPAGVEKFVAAARQGGVDVVTKRWPDSAHVRHFLEHPEEYRSLIHHHILNPILDGSSNGPS